MFCIVNYSANFAGMAKAQNIRLLKRSQIDEGKWNECLKRHDESYIYPYSWYLDAQGSWEALVYDDYFAVMPLPVKRKWGVKYFFNPIFCQQLGVFGDVSVKILSEFLKALPFSVRTQITFNSANLELLPKNMDKRQNYRLAIDQFDENRLSTNRKRDLKKAKGYSYSWTENTYQQAISFFKENDAQRFGLDENYFSQFSHVAKATKENARVSELHLYDKNNLIGTGLFFIYDKVMYLMSISVKNSYRNKGVNTRMVVEALHKGKLEGFLIFDFEGSSISSLAKFYASFGAQKMEYAFLSKGL